MASTTAFLGGSEATYSLPGTKTNNNLVGCLKKVHKQSLEFMKNRVAKAGQWRTKTGTAEYIKYTHINVTLNRVINTKIALHFMWK